MRRYNGEVLSGRVPTGPTGILGFTRHRNIAEVPKVLRPWQAGMKGLRPTEAPNAGKLFLPATLPMGLWLSIWKWQEHQSRNSYCAIFRHSPIIDVYRAGQVCPTDKWMNLIKADPSPTLAQLLNGLQTVTLVPALLLEEKICCLHRRCHFLQGFQLYHYKLSALQ